MKGKISVLIFTICFAAGTVCFGSAPQMGTWHLNEAKSKLATGLARNKVVVYTTVGDRVKVTVDGTDAKGNPAHSEWTGKFDGEFYRVTGDATSDARSYKKVDDRTLDLVVKHHGQIIITGRIVASADGNRRTVTTRRIIANGRRLTSIAVYDKK